MTTVNPEMITCGVCGTASEQFIIMSTSAFGTMDLDTRPPMPARANLPYEVQCCPNCGYCAEALTTGTPAQLQTVQSPSYQEWLQGDLHRTVAEYRCAGILSAEQDRLAEAGWFALKAAWTADDEAHEGLAKNCRELALGYWRAARQEGQRFGPDPASEMCLRIDAARRVGRFQRATAIAIELLEQDAPELFHRIAEYEIALCENEDAAAHTVEEALGDG